jgi:hypothetical protein
VAIDRIGCGGTHPRVGRVATATENRFSAHDRWADVKHFPLFQCNAKIEKCLVRACGCVCDGRGGGRGGGI